MRLPQEPRLPLKATDSTFAAAIKDLLRSICLRVNALSDGRISAIDNKATAAPTTGTWAQGDQVRNSAPTELGAVGSRYVIEGWVCVSGGTPGTWVQKRFLTGN